MRPTHRSLIGLAVGGPAWGGDDEADGEPDAGAGGGGGGGDIDAGEVGPGLIRWSSPTGS